MMDARWPDDFWANDPLKGGGNVLSQGCHTMDLVCHLNGAKPIRIFAEGGNYTHHGKDIIDNMVATIRFDNGAVATVAQGDSGQTPFVSKFSFQVTDEPKNGASQEQAEIGHLLRRRERERGDRSGGVRISRREQGLCPLLCSTTPRPRSHMLTGFAQRFSS